MQLKYRGCGNTIAYFVFPEFSFATDGHITRWEHLRSLFVFVDSTNVVATASMSAKVVASVYISDQSQLIGTFSDSRAME